MSRRVNEQGAREPTSSWQQAHEPTSQQAHSSQVHTVVKTTDTRYSLPMPRHTSLERYMTRKSRLQSRECTHTRARHTAHGTRYTYTAFKITPRSVQGPVQGRLPSCPDPFFGEASRGAPQRPQQRRQPGQQRRQRPHLPFHQRPCVCGWTLDGQTWREEGECGVFSVVIFFAAGASVRIQKKQKQKNTKL